MRHIYLLLHEFMSGFGSAEPIFVFQEIQNRAFPSLPTAKSSHLVNKFLLQSRAALASVVTTCAVVSFPYDYSNSSMGTFDLTIVRTKRVDSPPRQFWMLAGGPGEVRLLLGWSYLL